GGAPECEVEVRYGGSEAVRVGGLGFSLLLSAQHSSHFSRRER
ncbi:hypothetical protein A2U01_0064398, partial [Trifolium medium]|nr:hypothetical protein [Trifolium medium]